MAGFLAEPSKIKMILGRVKSSCALEGTPLENATRWVMDIDQNTELLELELLFKYRTEGRVIRSYSMAPLSSSFWGATAIIVDDGLSNSLKVQVQQSCRYRLAIDTIHSTTR
jgi:hypothetical protein